MSAHDQRAHEALTGLDAGDPAHRDAMTVPAGNVGTALELLRSWRAREITAALDDGDQWRANMLRNESASVFLARAARAFAAEPPR